MENVFDALCSALNEPQIKSLFLASEGIDLMVLMMKLVLIASEFSFASYNLQGETSISFTVYQNFGLRDVRHDRQCKL